MKNIIVCRNIAKNIGSTPFIKLEITCFLAQGNQKQAVRVAGISQCEVEMGHCSPPWKTYTFTMCFPHNSLLGRCDLFINFSMDHVRIFLLATRWELGWHPPTSQKSVL